MSSFILTQKQRQILTTIVQGSRAPDGTLDQWLDMDQLLEQLPYRTSRESMQFSLRALEKKGLLEPQRYEVRRGQRRRLAVPTSDGMSLVSFAPAAVIVEHEDFVEYE